MNGLSYFVAMTMLACTAINTPVYGIAIYYDRGQFIAAADSGLQLEDFEDIALGADGVAVFSNGAMFGDGAFSIESLTLDTDIPLTTSGQMGTFVIGPKSDNASINRQLLPGGGGGASDPGDDDDIRITFTQPVKAFGMLVIENLTEPNEHVSLMAADGREVISLPLPGGTSGGGSNTFMGFVAASELDYIQSVVVEEGQVLNDDIGFTWIYFEPVPEPSTMMLLFTGLWFGCTARSRRH
jgi:PEP-CTERM motif